MLQSLATATLSERETIGAPVALVVEDELMVTMHLTELLEKLNFTVASASTAATAMDLLRNQPLSVAFIADIHIMLPELPVVIASAYSDMAGRDIADGARYFPILSKLYEPTKLTGVLDKLGINFAS